MASGSVWGSTCRCPIHGQQQSPSWRHTSNNLAHLRGHSRPLLRPAEQEQPELQIENEYQLLSPVFYLALLLPSTVFRFIFLLVRCQCQILSVLMAKKVTVRLQFRTVEAPSEMVFYTQQSLDKLQCRLFSFFLKSWALRYIITSCITVEILIISFNLHSTYCLVLQLFIYFYLQGHPITREIESRNHLVSGLLLHTYRSFRFKFC